MEEGTIHLWPSGLVLKKHHRFCRRDGKGRYGGPLWIFSMQLHLILSPPFLVAANSQRIGSRGLFVMLLKCGLPQPHSVRSSIKLCKRMLQATRFSGLS